MSEAKQEIDAIGQVLTILNSLENDGAGRVLDYACDWFHWKCQRDLLEKLHAVAGVVAPADAGAEPETGGEDRAAPGAGEDAADAPRDSAGTT